MTKDPLHDAIIVTAGHEQRLEALESDSDAASVRDAARRLLDHQPKPFDGDPNQLRRDAQRLADLPRSGALSSDTGRWDEIVAANREVLVRDGVDPDTISIDSLFTPDVLARIEREWVDESARIDARLTEESRDSLLAATRDAVVDAIVRPLGLGRLVSHLDKVGGSVLTQHNAEQARRGAIDPDTLADPLKARAYADQQSAAEDGNRSLHSSKLFREAHTRTPTDDAYRDAPLTRPELDHVVAASVLDRDKRINFHFNNEEKDDIINSDDNLAWTNSSVNRSKAARLLPEWKDAQRPDGRTNGEHFGIDSEKAGAQHRKAHDAIERKVDHRQRAYYLAAIGRSSLIDATKVGLQEALGLALIDLTLGVFDEIADLWSHGRSHESLLADLLARVRRVKERVLGRGREIFDAFRDGALAGFLSTVVTAVINSVFTTAKRIVRVLREGMLSLIRAVRLLVAPPPQMDLRAACHESSKLIASAAIVAGGIMVEEVIEKAIVTTFPLLVPVAPIFAVAAVGLSTGVASTIVAWFIDRADLLGVVARERGERRIALLRERTERTLDELLAAQPP